MRDEMIPAAYRVVLVTLDAHAAGPVARATTRLAAEFPGLAVEVHAAAEWGGRPDRLAAARAAVERADLVIANMLFLEEHVVQIRPSLERARERADAFVGLIADPAVVKMTRMGDLDMSKPASAAVQLLKRLRGSEKPSGASGEKQVRLLRRLPKILRLIPGKAQDLRAWFLTMQYWLGGSDDNVAEMLRFLLGRYAARPDWRGAKAKAPVEYPDVGLWHPTTGIVTDPADLPRPEGATATVGLLVLRAYILAGDVAHYAEVVRAFEARGLAVVPAFAGGLDGRPAIEAYHRGRVDALVSLTGFSLVGGPAYNDSGAAVEALAALDVPYIAAHPLEFQTLGDWAASGSGLGPIETTMLVALPEIDGATRPTVFAGRHGGGRLPGLRAVLRGGRGAGDGALLRADRGAGGPGGTGGDPAPQGQGRDPGRRGPVRISAERRRGRHRRLAVGIREPSEHAAPHGGRGLRRRGAAGRRGAAHPGPEGQRRAVSGRKPTSPPTCRPRRSSATRPGSGEIEAVWGPAPGRVQSDGRGVFVLGATFGRVFVGVQPAFGWEGDPMRLLFEAGFAPTHAFSAFYLWLRRAWRADVVLHFGMHGALEFLPGKQAGAGPTCWPDRLIGNLPNVYLYAANNPSEATLAKRRIGAVTVTHLTPPLAKAGLYKGLAELKDSLSRLRALPPGDETRDGLAALIADQAAAVDLGGRAAGPVAAAGRDRRRADPRRAARRRPAAVAGRAGADAGPDAAGQRPGHSGAGDHLERRARRADDGACRTVRPPGARAAT